VPSVVQPAHFVEVARKTLRPMQPMQPMPFMPFMPSLIVMNVFTLK